MSIIPAKVCFKGFDARSEQALSEFFSSDCDNEFVVTNFPGEACITLVDLDVYFSKQSAAKLQHEFSHQVIVGISLTEYESEEPSQFFLRKPVDLTELHQQLLKAKGFSFYTRIKKQRELLASEERGAVAEKSVKSLALVKPSHTPRTVDLEPAKHVIEAMDIEAAKYVGKNSDIDFNNPQAVMQVVYNPAERFQGAVAKALKLAQKHQQAVELVCLGTGVIIDPIKKLALTAVGDSVLKPVCLMHVDRIDSLLRIKDSDKGHRLCSLAHKPIQPLMQWDLDAFLWKVALWCSRGRIPIDTNYHAPVYLSEWPNFTKLVCFPHALEIAAVLVNQPMKLTEVARYLQIPQRYVFGFYSACHALKLSAVSRRRVDHLFNQQVDEFDSKKSQIVKTILGFLNRKAHSSKKLA